MTQSPKDFILGGVLPGFGALFMIFVVVYSLSSGALTGVELATGGGLLVAGVVMAFVAKSLSHSAFFTNDRESH